ncbi:MAG TPA: hypoxanthine phosphoribosyltransferase [Gemmatimonadota bacterium]|nr:hypoxanthine phosphoribosyltransferase [Gemmatimonadota bacterium]
MSSDPAPLISAEEIAARVAEIAAEIDRDYADVDEVLMLGVLRGAYIFLADLSRQLSLPRRIDFISLSSYEKANASGGVRLIMDARVSLAGRHVLVVEDILDSGRTLAYLMRLFGARGPASLKSCVLVRKPNPEVQVDVDYVGFDIPDEWVVGYGLDYDDRYRALPYIGVLTPDQLD